MQDFTWEKTVICGVEGIRITAYTGAARRLSVPEETEGLPVLAIGRSAFRELPELVEVRLPDTVRSLGAYAFYHCPKLRKLSLTDSVEDYGDGVTRTCRKLFDLEIDLRRGRWSAVRDLLSDGDGKRRLRILLPADGVGSRQELSLIFPQYTNDCVFTEYDITKFHAVLEGSGFAYRNSVTKEGFHPEAYDSEGLFKRVVLEDRPLSLLLAAGRLQYPAGLSAEAAARYRAALSENAEEAFRLSLEPDHAGMTEVLLSEGLLDEKALDFALKVSAERHLTELSGRLIEYRRTRFEPKAPAALSLELPGLF